MDNDRDDRQPLLLPSRQSPRASGAGGSKPSTLLTVCPYILSNEFCERLAYNG
jgi:hypothetical protein